MGGNHASSGGRSEAMEDLSHANCLKHAALPKFSDDDKDDVDLLKRWLEKYAELQCWTEQEKLVQFELHLAGHAKRVYEVLPSTAMLRQQRLYRRG